MAQKKFKMDAIIAEHNKKYKEDIMTRGVSHIECDRIPFSSPRLNYCLRGGIPRNRIIEFAGDESSGKTTTALDLCGNAQKLFRKEWEDTDNPYEKERGEKKVLFLDCENTLDEEWAIKLGVDVANVYIINPQSQYAEELFQIVVEAIETDEIGLVIIDSLAVLQSRLEFEEDMEKKTYGGIAKVLTLFVRKVIPLCRKYNCTIVGINQLREDMSGFNRKITPGGKGWRFACSLRIFFNVGDYLDESCSKINKSSETPSGHNVEFFIAKNKLDPPNRKAGYYTLMYDYGVDSLIDLVDVAVIAGSINKAGAWFTLCKNEDGELLSDDNRDALKFQGKGKLCQFLYENEDIKNIVQKVTDKLV